MRQIYLLMALLTAVVQGAWADAGDTEENPITISSESDWNTFASNVNGGNNYSDIAEANGEELAVELNDENINNFWRVKVDFT